MRRVEHGVTVLAVSAHDDGPCAMAFPEEVRTVSLGSLAPGVYLVKGPMETLRFTVTR